MNMTMDKKNENEISVEDLKELEEQEKSLRSKIINRPEICEKKQMKPIPYIEKVQRRTPLTDNEKEISEIIIKNNEKYKTLLYFQPQLEMKELSLGKLYECEEYEDKNELNGKTELIETKYKKTTNKSLSEYLKSQISSKMQKNRLIEILVNTHLQLLESIEILQSIEPKIIHFHITDETLDYNEKDGTPVITDFRLSFTKTTLDDEMENKELFPVYENYNGYPFEIYLLSQEDKENKEEIANDFAKMTQLPIPEIPSVSSVNEIKKYFETWDIYAINEYIYRFLIDNRIPLDKGFMIEYKEILLTYLTSRPNERITIEKLKNGIISIFNSVRNNDYMDFLRTIITLK